MTQFRLLADPAGYVVSDADLISDLGQRQYWLDHFLQHFNSVLEHAKVAYGRTSGKQVETARKQFAAAIAGLRDNPASAGKSLGVIDLCRLREKVLRSNGLPDPFRHIKARENRAALDLYLRVIDYVESLPLEQRWDNLVRGVFAGNIFDLGSTATMQYATDSVDFEAVVEQVKPRPWLIDNLDALKAILPKAAADASPWAKAVVFLDNAGADAVLGVMPLVRQLAAHGTHIVLAANELPSLNDITADETVTIVEDLAETDPELGTYVQAGLFEVVSTGNDIPLIDLSQVSDELNEAAEGADLVVLEGMGRSVESNLNTKFAVDAMHICLLKDPSVAARVKGEVFDCVCMYQPKP